MVECLYGRICNLKYSPPEKICTQCGDYYLSSDAETDASGNPTGGIVKDGDTQDDYNDLDLQIRADLGKYGVVTYGMFNIEDNDPLPGRNNNYETYASLYGNTGLLTYIKWNIAF